MRRKVNTDGTITWKLPLTGEPTTEFERDITAGRWPAVVNTKTNKDGSKSYNVEVTMPEDVEDTVISILVIDMQMNAYRRGITALNQ